MTKLNLFVSGMFRSGTTLLARMLNAHPLICLASDPFAPIFKFFRNEIAIQSFGSSFDPNSPLDDYYFHKDKQILSDKIYNTPLNLCLKCYNIEQIRDRIINHCRPFSPQIIPYINDLCGASYEDVLKSGMNLVERVYGKGLPNVIGIKEVWTNEFVHHFLDTFENAKSILIIRDPRAVVASNYATSKNRYPFLFLCRQWRKLAELSFYYNNKYENVLLLRFEDLIANPETTARKICQFLNVEFNENLVDPTTFKDGANRSWEQNTSHNDAKRGFNKNVLEKWSQTLDAEMIRFVEAMCSNYMERLGYENKFDSNLPSYIKALTEFNEIESGIAEWIKPYIKYEKALEYKYEIDRLKVQ